MLHFNKSKAIIMKKIILVLAAVLMTSNAMFAQKKEVLVLTEEITKLNSRIDSLEKVCVANKVVTEQMEKMVSAYGTLEASYTTLQNSLTEQQKSLGDQKAINEKLNANLEVQIATVNKLLEKVDSLTAKLNQKDEPVKEETKLEYVGTLCNGLAAVRVGACYGYANAAGELVVPAEYDEVKNFENNYAIVRKNDKWGIIDKTGKMTVACQYDKIYLYNNDIYTVKKGTLHGLVKTNGSIVQAVKYVSINSLDEEENRAKIRLGDKWGYLDENGNIVISIKYNTAFNFNNGKAHVFVGNDDYYIDRNGNRKY